MMTQAELDFAVEFALGAGQYMVAKRNEAVAHEKLDRTVVTDVDTEINRFFIEAVGAQFVGASVKGEEQSALVDGSRILWVLDPVDDTGGYINALIADEERTSCIGIALFIDGILRLSVVYNPFRNELFVATIDPGYAILNGEALDLRSSGFGSELKGAPYDYCYWDDIAFDVRFMEYATGRPPLGSGSAINQACDVARGKSAFAIFPGNTMHDIAPGKLLVDKSYGIVSDLYVRPLQWDNLNTGVVYAANAYAHASVIEYLSANL